MRARAQDGPGPEGFGLEQMDNVVAQNFPVEAIFTKEERQDHVEAWSGYTWVATLRRPCSTEADVRQASD